MNSTNTLLNPWLRGHEMSEIFRRHYREPGSKTTKFFSAGISGYSITSAAGAYLVAGVLSIFQCAIRTVPTSLENRSFSACINGPEVMTTQLVGMVVGAIFSFFVFRCFLDHQTIIPSQMLEKTRTLRSHKIIPGAVIAQILKHGHDDFKKEIFAKLHPAQLVEVRRSDTDFETTIENLENERIQTEKLALKGFEDLLFRGDDLDDSLSRLKDLFLTSFEQVIHHFLVSKITKDNVQTIMAFAEKYKFRPLYQTCNVVRTASERTLFCHEYFRE